MKNQRVALRQLSSGFLPETGQPSMTKIGTFLSHDLVRSSFIAEVTGDVLYDKKFVV